MNTLFNRTDLSLSEIASEIRNFLDKPKNNVILFYASNGTGKTRLSRAFSDIGANPEIESGSLRDTLYFNALTEDLFTWNNEMRILKVDRRHNFVSRLENEDPEGLIGSKWVNYSDLEFSIRNVDTIGTSDFWEIEFFSEGKNEDSQSIKISRAEERLFIWSFFEVILEKAINSDEGFENINYIYIDDPISSMDENNAVKFAMGLVEKISNGIDKGKKFILSSHHSLFFNVLYNNFRRRNGNAYLINRKGENYSIEKTSDKLFMSHISLLSDIERAIQSESLSQYHFGNLRIVFEKTAVFLGYGNFSACIKREEDRELFVQALNLWSHGNHSLFETTRLLPEQVELFTRIFSNFKEDYNFNISV